MTDQEGVEKKEFNLQDLQKGSFDAFRIFFLKFYGDFFSFANLLLPDNISAKKLTSTAFFLLWEKHGDFDKEKNIRAFLYACIRDGTLQYLRHIRQHSGPKEDRPGTPIMGAFPHAVLQELLAFADSVGHAG
jgi:DNA-directed RNA polymerase specialized sigma24 family protein